MPSSYVKDPGDTKDYAVDWRAEMTLHADAIQSSNWSVPAGITQTTPAPSSVGGITTIWLLGGTADQDYRVTNTVTTTGGRTLERSFTIKVRDQ